MRTSLTLATKVSLVLDDAICRVFQRKMLLSSSNVSVGTMVQGPSVFSLKCHPRRSRPESDEGRCRVEAVSGIVGATIVLCGSAAKKFFSSCRLSSISWVLDAGFCALMSAMSCMYFGREAEMLVESAGATSGGGWKEAV